jgi:hypothetical protein
MRCQFLTIFATHDFFVPARKVGWVDGPPEGYGRPPDRQTSRSLERTDVPPAAPERPVTESDLVAVRKEAEIVLNAIESSEDLATADKTRFREEVTYHLNNLNTLRTTATQEMLAEARAAFAGIQDQLDVDVDAVLADVPGIEVSDVGAPVEADGGESLQDTLVAGETVSGVIQGLLQSDPMQRATVADFYGLENYNPDNDPDCMKLLVHLFPWKNGAAADEPLVGIDGIEDKYAIHTPEVGDKITIHPDGRIQVVRPAVEPDAADGTETDAATAPEATSGATESSDEDGESTPTAAVVAAPVVTAPDAPSASAAAVVAGDAPSAAPEAGSDTPEGAPEGPDAKTLASIHENLTREPGVVGFDYFTPQGPYHFLFRNGIVEVQKPDGSIETHALSCPDASGRSKGGDSRPHFYVREQPIPNNPPKGTFKKTENGIWYHGSEPTKREASGVTLTDRCIGMTPAKVYEMATAIVGGQITPEADRNFPLAEKHGLNGAHLMQAIDSAVLEKVGNGPVGYREVASASREGQTVVRVYAPASDKERHSFENAIPSEGRGDGYMVMVEGKRVAAKNVKEDDAGNLIVIYQFPGGPRMKLTFEKGKEPIVTEEEEAAGAPAATPKEGPKGDTEAIPGSMQSYIQRYRQDVPNGTGMFVHREGARVDAQVVNVDGTFFYRPGETGDWHMANPDGKTSRLYEGDPIAMNTLENRLATLGIKYTERATAPLQVGDFSLTPDKEATTGTLVVYSGAVPNASAETANPAVPHAPFRFTVNVTGAPDTKEKFISVLVSQEGTTTETVCKDKVELEACLKALKTGDVAEEPTPDAPKSVDAAEPGPAIAAAAAVDESAP